MEKIIKINHVIKVLDRDKERCSSKCSYTEKINGIYHCNLFNKEIDEGDDDDRYIFVRCQECKDGEE